MGVEAEKDTNGNSTQHSERKADNALDLRHCLTMSPLFTRRPHDTNERRTVHSTNEDCLIPLPLHHNLTPHAHTYGG